MDWLKATFTGAPVGVDRERNRLLGYVVAERGPFKTKGRGAFDALSLSQITSIGNSEPQGLKARFTHPTLSADGLGKFLGRSTNFRLDGDKVRADLAFDPSAFNTPHGDLAGYVMTLAESDPNALSSSLAVRSVVKEKQLSADGKPAVDDKGEPLPPLWRITGLHASDIVDTGEAVNGLLAIDGLPDELVRRAAELLDEQLGEDSREQAQAKCLAWLDRYLSLRFGEPEQTSQAYLLRLKNLKLKLQCRQ